MAHHRRTARASPLALLVLLQLLLLATTRSVAAEPVCPDDAFVVLKDGEDVESSSRRLEATSSSSLVTIVRQLTSTVEFTVTSTEVDFEKDGTTGSVPDHIFVSYGTDVFQSETCPLYDDLEPGSSTPAMTAYCLPSAHKGHIAVVKVIVRRQRTAEDGCESGAVPKCCHDPFETEADSYCAVEYVYEIPCEATCDDPDSLCGEGTASPLSRDLVTSSQRNGPHHGSSHGWAWPSPKDGGCTRYANVDNDGPGANAEPCNIAEKLDENRVLGFDSAYMSFRFAFDDGMTATISLPDGSESLSFYPTGESSGSSACDGPPECCWHDYPIRLVKSGRYLHHWYVEKVDCNGSDNDTRLEIKVTSDCVELYTVSNEGAKTMSWVDADSQETLTSSANGYSAISYCVQCDSEITGDPFAELAGCSIVETTLPDDCCLLNPAGDRDGEDLCGSGWSYDLCPSTALATTPMTDDVTLSTSPSYAVTADGHSFQVAMSRGTGNQLVNDSLVATIQNDSDRWKKVKVNFHIVRTRRSTGVSGVLLDPDTNEPTGIHVQMSKNWHETRPVLYDSYWWTGVAHFRVPPGETKLKLVVAYQYYEGLHGVSHSQLSLLGWGTNGLWEEVGLGSNGESITYEPHGHHRRQMILDTRPWLVCQLGVSGCRGTPDSTQWTENIGGGDFLTAVDDKGLYQYLVRDTAFHTMNGPRLTNATYVGVTVDEKIEVSRTVSTWTADDLVRHLHSFEYTFLEETAGDHYPRFAMYTLGGDNYNYVEYPSFAYGSGDSNAMESAGDDPTEEVRDIISGVANFRYTDYYSVDAPAGCSIAGGSGSCWFAMLTDPSQDIHERAHRGIIVRNFRGRLNGQEWPPSGDATVSPFTFNLVRPRGNNPAKNTVSLELSLPASFKALVALGQASFLEGDFLAADIEVMLPPRQNSDYFGFSDRLRTWLTDAGSDDDYEQGWKLVANEAAAGDAMETTVFDGSLERKYHPRVRVDCGSNEARFNVAIPEGLPGILPITVAGVAGPTAGPLDAPVDLRLWRWVDGSWTTFATGGAYQLEKDVLDGTYTYVYSLSLEFENQSNSGPPAEACERFYFGAGPPDDENPPCPA